MIDLRSDDDWKKASAPEKLDALRDHLLNAVGAIEDALGRIQMRSNQQVAMLRNDLNKLTERVKVIEQKFSDEAEST